MNRKDRERIEKLRNNAQVGDVIQGDLTDNRSKGQKRYDKIKDVSIDLSKNVAKKKGDEFLEKTSVGYRGYKKAKQTVDKIKKRAKKTKKYTQWLIRFVKFCISSPLGWIVGGITIALLIWLGASIANSFDKDDQIAEVEGLHNTVNSGGVAYDALNSSADKNNALDADEVTLLTGNDVCALPTNQSLGKSSKGVSSEAIMDGDWKREGSLAYNNAKLIFDGWVDRGLSGAAAAAIVGWVESEGGFNSFGMAEGYHGLPIEQSSLKYGVEPIPSGSYGVGGGGSYQFTPYTKFRKLGDPDWEDYQAQIQFIVDSINGKIPEEDGWMEPGDATGMNHTFEQFAKLDSDDAAHNVLIWNAHERRAQWAIQRDVANGRMPDAARFFYDAFKAKDIKFNKEKYEKNFGSSVSGPGVLDAIQKPKTSVTNCAPAHSGGTGWAADGEGEISYGAYTAWRNDEVPNEIKKYLLDPVSVGLAFMKASPAWDAGASGLSKGQCTALSAALGYALWEKDGQHPNMQQGNGKEVAANWASTFNGKVTNKPTAGAIWSSPAVWDNPYGHTGIVAHVFKNDKIVIVEQNYSGYSGEGAPGLSVPFVGQYMWNYRVVEKSDYETWQFFDPSTVGYKLSASARSK